MDINALVERTPPATSPGNASTTSRGSNSSRARDGTTASVRSFTAATTPAPLSRPLDLPQQQQQQPLHPSIQPMMQTAQYPVQPYPPPLGASHYPPMQAYPRFHPMAMQDPRYGPPVSSSHAPGINNKRLAPPHPAESPAKKKQSKWTPDEDASIIELRGNGMKWEDISKHLPGRSAISCRLRFQNYLERRTEWDDEKKNKLARLYERYFTSCPVLSTRQVANETSLAASRKICGRRSRKKCNFPGARQRPCTGSWVKRTWLAAPTSLSFTSPVRPSHPTPTACPTACRVYLRQSHQVRCRTRTHTITVCHRSRCRTHRLSLRFRHDRVRGGTARVRRRIVRHR